MANNTDLVDAIDEAIECIEDNTYHNGAEFRTYEMDEQQRELVRVSLIRARDAITKAQGELMQLSESTDSMGHPVFARQLMDIHDILSAYTPEEK